MITGCLFDDNAGVLGHPLCLGAIWRYLRHDELAGLAQVGKSIGQ